MKILLNAYNFWNYELKNTKTFAEIENSKVFNPALSLKMSLRKSRRESYAKFMFSAEYELIINLVTITNFLMIVVRMNGLSDER